MLADLLSEFSPVSKQEWLAKIEKDLKGRPLSDLFWQLNGLEIDPFASLDDFDDNVLQPIVASQNNNDWEIGEDILIKNDVKSANKTALDALMGGANAPCFHLDKYIAESHLEALLDGIELDYIATYFNEKSQNTSPLAFLKIFKKYAEKQGKNPVQLRGGVAYDPFADGRYDVHSATETIQWAKENLPHFEVININGSRFYNGSQNVIEELSQTLKAGEIYLNKLISNGLNVEDIAPRIGFTFQIGISYFIEVAKIRAFKLLWANVLQAYGASPSVANIHAIVGVDPQVHDANTNKIKGTTQAMSAVIAGVKRLIITRSDYFLSENTPFSNRIARNIQHLLKMESYFDKVIDPAAGSYYIEKLTAQIAEKVWEHL